MAGKKLEQEMAELAKFLAYYGVRNSLLEDIHSGNGVRTATGDYSDVKVVGPDGEIPWRHVSRISDAEMKALMIDITNRLFTLLMGRALIGTNVPSYWQAPEIVEEMTPEFLAQMLRRRETVDKR